MTYVSDKELSQKCFEFYNTGYENKVALPDAILRWQKSLGYDSDVTVNWIAICNELGYPYRGDIDIQDRFATGEVSFETAEGSIV